jgi:hypothetical protein
MVTSTGQPAARSRKGRTGDSNGTIFRLSVGLGPFVKTLPTAGKPGETIIILGTDLGGITGVTFHGLPAGFTVLRPSEILAVVSIGATTGQVQVTTASGVLSSNVPFQIAMAPGE